MYGIEYYENVRNFSYSVDYSVGRINAIFINSASSEWSSDGMKSPRISQRTFLINVLFTIEIYLLRSMIL